MSRGRQTAIGLGLAAALLAAWLATHVYGVFFYRWTPLGRVLALPYMLVECWLGAGLFIVAHDAMHGSLAPGRPWLNRAVGRTCLGIYAAFPYDSLLPKHHAHHRHAGAEGDPDFHVAGPRRFWRWYMGFFREYFGWGQMLIITLVFTVYWSVLRAPVWNCILFWSIPSVLSSLQLFVFGTWLPHRHEDAPFADRHNARTLQYSWLVSLITCFHFGYHHEHHLSPQTPWWALPRRRRELSSRPVKPDPATVRGGAHA
ncbi:MAG: fatty acid desaturase [Caulobacteraceae bacterium]|nr:fatty acid desaturase [Caulobacter sp.]